MAQRHPKKIQELIQDLEGHFQALNTLPGTRKRHHRLLYVKKYLTELISQLHLLQETIESSTSPTKQNQ